MNDHEIEVALAGMPECEGTLLMSEHPRKFLYGDYREWPTAIAQKTGCLPLCFNSHSRKDGGPGWKVDGIVKAVEAGQKCSRRLTIVIAHSPFLGMTKPIDPMTVSLKSLDHFAMLGDMLDEVIDTNKVEEIITILDSEGMEVDRLGKDDQYAPVDNAKNAAIDTIHAAFSAIAASWGDVWHYAAISTFKRMTWRKREGGINVDSQAFKIHEPDGPNGWHRAVEAAEKKLVTFNKQVSTCHVADGAGYDKNGVWQYDYDYDPDITRAACKWLTGKKVIPVLHPHPFNTSDGVRHLRAAILGVNESVGG